MVCRIRHEHKNNHNVGCPEKGLCRTFGPSIILQKDNCQNILDDHLNAQKWVKMEENSSTTGRGRGLLFRYAIKNQS